jgi:hypothetical protein
MPMTRVFPSHHRGKVDLNVQDWGVSRTNSSGHGNTQTGGMSSKNPVGGQLVAIGHRTLLWAVDAILQTVPPEELSKLNVRTGEHLAAILTTAFWGVAPNDIDTAGGVDLSFRAPRGDRPLNSRVFPAGMTEAAFEVKSLPGPHREWEQGLERDEARGLDPTGRVRAVGTIERANGVLLEAHSSVRKAVNQLNKKTSAATSRNVFLLVHPFDHMAIECIENDVIGPLLDPLEGVNDLATVWVLWVPNHLTMWSGGDSEWIDLFFRVATPEELRTRDPDRLAMLQEAEAYYLERIGHAGRSPYLFRLSSS